MSTQDAIELLQRKVARRRHLNQPDVRQQRGATTSIPLGITLTFTEAEQVIALLEMVRSGEAADVS